MSGVANVSGLTQYYRDIETYGDITPLAVSPSGHEARQSLPLSPVCGGELERGAAPPANQRPPTRHRLDDRSPRPLPSFPRRREPRSGATAARSIPLSPVCSGPLHRLRGRAREGAAPPANQRTRTRHSRESGNPGRPLPVIPAQAGTSQRRDSGAVHPPLPSLLRSSPPSAGES